MDGARSHRLTAMSREPSKRLEINFGGLVTHTRVFVCFLGTYKLTKNDQTVPVDGHSSCYSQVVILGLVSVILLEVPTCNERFSQIDPVDKHFSAFYTFPPKELNFIFANYTTNFYVDALLFL